MGNSSSGQEGSGNNSEGSSSNGSSPRASLSSRNSVQQNQNTNQQQQQQQQQQQPPPASNSQGSNNTDRESISSSASAASSSSSAASASSSQRDSLRRPTELDNATPEQLSYWQMAKQGYQDLVNAIVRPPRCIYEIDHLGPMVFEFCGSIFQRRDIVLTNPRGLRIMCSMWEPLHEFRKSETLPCVVYMHGNSSARLEALSCLSLVLGFGATLFAFDFCGSGLSDGEYVSLGAFEKDDLNTVIDYLRKSGTTSSIALWGRSMGAATALMHGERDATIAGMVLDSAFADLVMLAEEMVEKGRQNGLYAPHFIVRLAIWFIRSSVLKTANFDIKAISPIEYANKCFIPALFICGERDTFVIPKHSERICEKYGGEKNILMVPGDHNSPRPKLVFEAVAVFLTRSLQLTDELQLPHSQRYITTLPWYASRGQRMVYSVNAQQVGMTQERQDDVRSKLYRVLGDNKTSSSVAQKSSSTTTTTKPSGKKTEVSNPVYDASRETKGRNSNGGGSSYEDEMLVQQSEWECSTCTLINTADAACCSACSLPRFGHF